MKHLDHFAAVVCGVNDRDAAFLWGALSHEMTVAARGLYFEEAPDVAVRGFRGVNEALHRVTAGLWALAVGERSRFGGPGNLVQVVREHA